MAEWSGYFDTPGEDRYGEFREGALGAERSVQGALQGKASQEVLLLRGG